ncbi:heat shock protein Hsp20 [Solidesulfovibrio carbinoliphilus subsp. oakridgensis]|uniref:Heat shock protein Hsp20 n=1 Tax=Solidesulfovibrio carbinoliphilus subsp. oakridgensis TaxID=694327 RepID=G7Q9Y8_9BACT|nr:Hsp20/alpha crystallin family protein [Solidesulfovibrio carbinoliphilus]EHJ47818.1 heat shock protein Hsp20 [Solidesulfovibrio carbinoliphilus subsp. oakridgensis]
MVIDLSPFYGATTPFDRLFESLWPSMAISQRSMAYPPINIGEDDENLYVRCEIPGMDMEALDLTLTDSSLVIKGERQAVKGKYYRQERPTGFFQRVVNIQAGVAREKVSATMRDGVLEVVLPKSDESKPKKISIEPV